MRNFTGPERRSALARAKVLWQEGDTERRPGKLQGREQGEAREEPRAQTLQGHLAWGAKALDTQKESAGSQPRHGVEAAAAGGGWVVNERGDHSSRKGALS